MITYPEAALQLIEAVEVCKAYQSEYLKAREAWQADEGKWAEYSAALDQWAAAKQRAHDAQQIIDLMNQLERLSQGWARLKPLPVQAVPAASAWLVTADSV